MTYPMTVLMVLTILTGALSHIIPNDPASQPTRCIAAAHLHEFWYAEKEIRDVLVDEMGESCFKPLSYEIVDTLVTKTSLDEVFGAATAQICPTWTSSKKCLERHLDTKCSGEERRLVKDNYGFNEVLVMTELLCEPPNGFSLLDTFKRAAVDGGLGDCMSSHDFGERMEQCQPLVDNVELPSTPFATRISVVYNCSVEAMKTCAGGNETREVEMHDLWKEAFDAITAAKAMIWHQMEAPEKSVLSDSITGFTAGI